VVLWGDVERLYIFDVRWSGDLGNCGDVRWSGAIGNCGVVRWSGAVGLFIDVRWSGAVGNCGDMIWIVALGSFGVVRWIGAVGYCTDLRWNRAVGNCCVVRWRIHLYSSFKTITKANAEYLEFQKHVSWYSNTQSAVHITGDNYCPSLPHKTLSVCCTFGEHSR